MTGIGIIRHNFHAANIVNIVRKTRSCRLAFGSGCCIALVSCRRLMRSRSCRRGGAGLRLTRGDSWCRSFACRSGCCGGSCGGLLLVGLTRYDRNEAQGQYNYWLHFFKYSCSGAGCGAEKVNVIKVKNGIKPPLNGRKYGP